MFSEFARNSQYTNFRNVKNLVGGSMHGPTWVRNDYGIGLWTRLHIAFQCSNCPSKILNEIIGNWTVLLKSIHYFKLWSQSQCTSILDFRPRNVQFNLKPNEILIRVPFRQSENDSSMLEKVLNDDVLFNKRHMYAQIADFEPIIEFADAWAIWSLGENIFAVFHQFP